MTDYLTAGNQVETSGVLTIEEIAQTCSSSKVIKVDSDTEDEAIEVEERAPITGPVARQACIQLRQYFEENGLDPSLLPTFDRIEDTLMKNHLSKMKQPTIHDFFTPK